MKRRDATVEAVGAGTPAPEGRLSDRAYAAFKTQLFSGGLKPGQFVSQRELVELIGVPLGPTREAVQKLALEGFVQIVPQRGIQVAGATPKMIRDAFQLRVLVEKEAALQFAECASDAEIEDLAEAHRAVVAAAAERIDDGLLERAQATDRDMHDVMVRRLNNEFVWNIHCVNSDRIRLIRLDHGLLTPANLRSAMDEHLAILDACARRDAAAAAYAMEVHLSTAMRRAMGV
ncbi:MAG: GntR family transcriptional regulator [Azospirillaceae bacterium]